MKPPGSIHTYLHAMEEIKLENKKKKGVDYHPGGSVEGGIMDGDRA